MEVPIGPRLTSNVAGTSQRRSLRAGSASQTAGGGCVGFGFGVGWGWG